LVLGNDIVIYTMTTRVLAVVVNVIFLGFEDFWVFGFVAYLVIWDLRTLMT